MIRRLQIYSFLLTSLGSLLAGAYWGWQLCQPDPVGDVSRETIMSQSDKSDEALDNPRWSKMDREGRETP